MVQETMLDKLRALIGKAGWKMYLWAIQMTADQYFEMLYKDWKQYEADSYKAMEAEAYSHFEQETKFHEEMRKDWLNERGQH